MAPHRSRSKFSAQPTRGRYAGNQPENHSTATPRSLTTKSSLYTTRNQHAGSERAQPMTRRPNLSPANTNTSGNSHNPHASRRLSRPRPSLRLPDSSPYNGHHSNPLPSAPAPAATTPTHHHCYWSQRYNSTVRDVFREILVLEQNLGNVLEMIRDLRPDEDEMEYEYVGTWLVDSGENVTATRD